MKVSLIVFLFKDGEKSLDCAIVQKKNPMREKCKRDKKTHVVGPWRGYEEGYECQCIAWGIQKP